MRPTKFDLVIKLKFKNVKAFGLTTANYSPREQHHSTAFSAAALNAGGSAA
jgi:hypothetical protein